jgi:dipeptidyl aminopeptidase/acylaminoacyl peptidase
VLQHSGDAPDDLLLWTLGSSSPPVPYLNAPWAETSLQVSPDGSLAAYLSNERGPFEVWVREFPVPQGKWRVSDGPSAAPRWSPDGRHLYYTHAGGGSGIDTLYRARLDRTRGLSVGPKEVLYIGDLDGIANWDLHPDGKRFVAVVPPASGPAQQSGAAGVAASPQEARFLITLNWAASLERLMSQQR